MTAIRDMILAFFIGALLAGVTGWRLTKNYVDAEWQVKIDKQKSEASAKLQDATEKVLVAERKASALAKELGVRDEIKRHELDAIGRENRRLVAELGGLRDPGRRPSCGGPAKADAEPATAVGEPADSGNLSDAASEFLLELTRDADEVARYADTCHQWVKGLKHVD